MSVQNYETDILQEHTDSTPVLVARLNQWRHAVYTVQQYIQGYYTVHQGITAHLEKTLKSINDVPTFEGLTQASVEAAAASSRGSGSSSPTTVGAPGGSGGSEGGSNAQLSSVFKDLQQNVNLLLQRSVATTNGIKSSILPSLDNVAADIEKHYKTLKTQGGRGQKEIERCREHTQRLVEQLAQVTSSYGSRALSSSDDPLIIHRKVEAAVAEQIARENTQAEAALSVQQSFKSLESHVVATVTHSLTTLATLNEGFDRSEYEVNSTITQLFQSIDMNAEWTIFAKANQESLVPSTNYQRDPRFVTFVNDKHPSTKPVLQGLLNRKGTVLKSYNQSFYVISPTGYLYQFKSAEPTQDQTPELSLFLPSCQVSRSSKVGEHVFKIVGKDSHKAISTRHKFVFKTGSAQELDAWFTAVSRLTGNIADDDSAEFDAATPGGTPGPSSPVVPPTQQMANTSLDQSSSSGRSTPHAAAAAASAYPGGAQSPAVPQQEQFRAPNQPQHFQQQPQQQPQQFSRPQASSGSRSPAIPARSRSATPPSHTPAHPSGAAPAYTPHSAQTQAPPTIQRVRQDMPQSGTHGSGANDPFHGF